MTVLQIFFVQTDWPYPMALEGPLDIQGEGLLLGTQDDIAEILRESARILNPDQTNNFACLLLFSLLLFFFSNLFRQSWDKLCVGATLISVLVWWQSMDALSESLCKISLPPLCLYCSVAVSGYSK